MAIFKNTYAETKPLDPMFTTGRSIRIVQAKISKTSAVKNGDVFVLAETLPAGARIHRIMLPKGTKAIEGMADVDFGFYSHKDNKVIKKDALVDGQSFVAALGNVDILGANVANFEATKVIPALLGLDYDEIPDGGFDLCATINTAGTAVGEIELDIYIEQD